MMPRMDGYQVVARIKGNVATRNIPVIMVTALDDHNARMLVLSAGAEDFVTKPVDRAELCMRARNLLRLKAYGDYHDKMDAIGQLASGVVNDFNNLLTVILGFTELVTAEVDMASQQGQDLGEITRAAQRATGLARQLLAFSRQQVLHGAPLEMSGLVTGSHHDVPAPAVAAMAATAGIKSAPQTVLLVGDDAGVRRLSKRILDNAGYRVLDAANGDDADRLCAHHAGSIDLVVTDVIMSGGGPELFRRLLVQAPAAKVLYLSGYTEDSVAQKAGLDRALPYIQKPFTASEFLRKVRDALDR
jgi:DNA-binding response OmpR family regulator